MFLAQSHHAVSIHSTVDVGRERGCRDDRRVEVRHRDVEIKQRRSTIYHADQWSSTFPHVVFSRFVIRSCKARYTLATTSTVADTVDFVADTVHFVAVYGMRPKQHGRLCRLRPCRIQLCRQCVPGLRLLLSKNCLKTFSDYKKML